MGDAVRAWCRETHTSRRDVFVTTKIIAPKKTMEETMAALHESVSKVNLDGKSMHVIQVYLVEMLELIMNLNS